MDPSALSTLPPGRCWPNQRPCSYCRAVSASSGTGFIAIRHAGPKTRVHFKSTKLRPPSACSGCFFIFSRLNSIGPATVSDWKTRNRVRWKVSKLPARRLVSVTRHMLRLLNKCCFIEVFSLKFCCLSPGALFSRTRRNRFLSAEAFALRLKPCNFLRAPPSLPTGKTAPRDCMYSNPRRFASS